MSEVYLISDLHFYHDKVIRFNNRPFVDVEEMNHMMILNWNSIVNKNDKVFVLGDIAFYCNKSMLTNIIRKLKGNKVLIMGNHDRRKSISWWYDVGFKEVYKYPILYNNDFILSHEPIKNVPNNYLNVHGHVHIHSWKTGNNINVSCEVLNYFPINFKYIRDLFYRRNK